MIKLILIGSMLIVSSACYADGSDQLISLLNKHVHCLKIVCSPTCNKQLIDMESFLRDNEGIEYKHELTRLALKKISIQGTLIPLFESWDLFLQRYRLVNSDLFMREFSVMLFFTYKNILSRYSFSKVTLTDVLHLSSQIMSLPIDQVLNALERCYHQFIRIMSAYGLQPGISLSVWIRRYWWVPPVVVISFIYSTFCHFFFNNNNNNTQSAESWFDFPANPPSSFTLPTND